MFIHHRAALLPSIDRGNDVAQFFICPPPVWWVCVLLTHLFWTSLLFDDWYQHNIQSVGICLTLRTYIHKVCRFCLKLLNVTDWVMTVDDRELHRLHKMSSLQNKWLSVGVLPNVMLNHCSHLNWLCVHQMVLVLLAKAFSVSTPLVCNLPPSEEEVYVFACACLSYVCLSVCLSVC